MSQANCLIALLPYYRFAFDMRRMVYAVASTSVISLLLTSGCDKIAKATKEQTSNRSITVKKGDFPVVFRVDGQLDAIKNHPLSFNGKRGSRELKLTFVTPEHSLVKSNDVVFRISEEFFKRQETELLRKIQTAELNVAMAQNDIEMIQADNINDLKTALDTLKTSVDTFNKYDKEDAPKKKRDIQQAVETKINAMEKADVDLTLARKALADAYALDEYKQMAAASKVNEAEITLDKARQDVDSSFYDLRVFKRYDHPEKLQTSRETVKRNTIAVQRGIVNNETRQTKKAIELETEKASIDDLKFELKEIQEDMQKLEIRAPAMGTLFYGNPENSRWRGRSEETLREGSEIWIGQVIAYIPDMASFRVETSIPEEFRSRVKVGLPVHIKAKAIPDLLLNGSIESIAAAATPIVQWDAQSPKVYSTQISTDKSDARLTSGMTVQVEIIVETIKDALYVPIEAVYTREGGSYVKVESATGPAEERKVKTARFSADYIEMTEGLTEGDRVLLVRTAL
jgi:HlyD family secretion protein